MKLDSSVGRRKAKFHTYIGVKTNGNVGFFVKPPGEDNSFEEHTDITIIGCSGTGCNYSDVVKNLNFVPSSNNFSIYNPKDFF